MVQPSLGARIIGPVVLPEAQLRPWHLTELPRQNIVPLVGFPKRESEHIPGSPYLWTYAGGPGLGGKPVTFLRIERRRDRSPEPGGLEPEARRAGGRRSELEGRSRRAGIWSQDVRPKPEVNTIRPYGNPKPETRPVLRRPGD